MTPTPPRCFPWRTDIFTCTSAPPSVLEWRSNSTAEVPVWKIDAETGRDHLAEILRAFFEDGVSGGVQSTIAVGKEELSH